MNQNRRTFLKSVAATWAASVMAGETTPSAAREQAQQAMTADPTITWSKAPCRFCGTGCGVMVGVRDNKIVAVAGDTQSPVNKGKLCVKGYHLPFVLYGEDRLKKPLIRENGKLREAAWPEALDLIASKFKESRQNHGKDSVAIYGSGQWTLQDGYAASKLMKGGLGSNNIEANARLCMASAVAGFMKSFGKDEPMGCYDDFEAADVFVLWGNNMAEMHPVLFSRLLERRAGADWVKIVDLTTRTTRTSQAADSVLLFKPNTDLAIPNGIAHLLIKKGSVNRAFVDAHCLFRTDAEDIGFGLRGGKPYTADEKTVSFEAFAALMEPYTPEYVAQVSGLTVAQIEQLAGYYANPETKVTSLWCMGVNQHTRGTWMNNLIYNLHLLTGKISTPGNSPFSLTGQPSACGTVREVGTLTHLLPGGRTVTDLEHRAFAEKTWGVPAGTIPDKPSDHTMNMFRKLVSGDIKVMWIQVTNPMVTLPDLNHFMEGIAKSKPFLVVSDIYPTPTTAIADVVLPSACWVEREGCFGNSERRTQQWNKLVEPPGEARPDSWQLIELAKRLDLGHLFPWDSEEVQAEGLFTEYRQFTVGVGKDLATYADLKQARGKRWPVVDGHETRWRYIEGEDPYVPKGAGYDFYGNKKFEHKALIWFRPYAEPPESPDAEFPLWLCTGRVLEHWHTGSMTRRVKELHQAMPEAYVELHPEDARKAGISDGAMVKLVTRRGQLTLKVSVNRRAVPMPGHVFVPFFDESMLVNQLTLDAHCPLSKQPDYKKCAVRLERV